MRKILLFLLLCIIIPSSCFANYFDDRPWQYICYQNDIQYKSYIDMNSVSVIRYDPPYYTIDATTYTFDYVNQFGLVKVNRYFYDYNKQQIYWNMINIGKCFEDGTSSLNPDNPLEKPIGPIYLQRYSTGYMAAELAFMKSYNAGFTH